MVESLSRSLRPLLILGLVPLKSDLELVAATHYKVVIAHTITKKARKVRWWPFFGIRRKIRQGRAGCC